MNPIKYLQEVVAEARQVTWPNRETLIQLSIVVISLSFVIAVVLGGFDFLLTNGIGYLTRPSANQPAIVPQEITATPTTSSATPVPTLNIKK